MIWRQLHNHAIRKCDAIFHAEPNRLAYFKQHYDAGETPQYVLENFPAFIEKIPSRPEPEKEVRVIYLGGLGEDRFTFEIMEAFSKMPDHIKLDIVGSGRPAFVADVNSRLSDLDAPNVRLLPAVPYRDIPKLLAHYHIGIALYRNTNLNNYYCAPNKVYDYIMNGIPVITNHYPGLVNVVEANKVGACLSEVNNTEIQQAVKIIFEEKRWRNINEDLRLRYCWERQEAGYLSVFNLKK
jgi:glycosyltransferase involved in cell wall biosynthesis